MNPQNYDSVSRFEKNHVHSKFFFFINISPHIELHPNQLEIHYCLTLVGVIGQRITIANSNSYVLCSVFAPIPDFIKKV